VSDKSAIVTRGAPESKANGATASFLHLQSKQVTLAAGTLQPRRPSDQAGFALVLTLVVIAVLALVTQMMSAWLTTALEDAIANQHEVEAQQQMADAQGDRALPFGGLPGQLPGPRNDGWASALDRADRGTAQRREFHPPR
jgi:hypothetical protein